jgi:peptidyl-dipeptidase Dcp
MNWHTVSNEADFKPTLVLKTSTRKIRIISKRSLQDTILLILRTFGQRLFCWLLCVYQKTLDYNVWLDETNGLTRENSERFRKYILSVVIVDLKQVLKNPCRHDLKLNPILRKCRTSNKITKYGILCGYHILSYPFL